VPGVSINPRTVGGTLYRGGQETVPVAGSAAHSPGRTRSQFTPPNAPRRSASR